ncbi:MAG: hypothetical protein HQM01_08160 [Magnetococcales bacterium]|nr:hypothetical protein [Magnetococcales bacterium]
MTRSKGVQESRLRELSARLHGLSEEMRAVGKELIACGYPCSGGEMIGAGDLACDWSDAVAVDAAQCPPA